MSMAVDLTTPLTKAERDYLNERGRLADIERADNLHGGTPEDAPAYNGDGTGPGIQQLNTGLATVARPEDLLRQLRDMGVNVQVVDEADEADEGVETDEVPPYEAWKSADINTEIDRRNVGRTDGEKISKAGSVSERADRLYVDDEKSSQPQ